MRRCVAVGLDGVCVYVLLVLLVSVWWRCGAVRRGVVVVSRGFWPLSLLHWLSGSRGRARLRRSDGRATPSSGPGSRGASWVSRRRLSSHKWRSACNTLSMMNCCSYSKMSGPHHDVCQSMTISVYRCGFDRAGSLRRRRCVVRCPSAPQGSDSSPSQDGCRRLPARVAVGWPLRVGARAPQVLLQSACRRCKPLVPQSVLPGLQVPRPYACRRLCGRSVPVRQKGCRVPTGRGARRDLGCEGRRHASQARLAGKEPGREDAERVAAALLRRLRQRTMSACVTVPMPTPRCLCPPPFPRPACGYFCWFSRVPTATPKLAATGVKESKRRHVRSMTSAGMSCPKPMIKVVPTVESARWAFVVVVVIAAAPRKCASATPAAPCRAFSALATALAAASFS